MFFSDQFISAGSKFCTFDEHVSAPEFKKTFVLNDFRRAELTICGLGFYEIAVNGVGITKGRLAPYISNPDELLCYDCYDVTPYLKEGQNELTVLLGNGMLNAIGGSTWDFDKAAFRSAPKFALAFEADGKCLFEADERFLCRPSPILFDDLRTGEWYDARLEGEGLWQPAVSAVAPQGKPHLVRCESIRIVEEIAPVSVIRQKDGILFDFGINTAGVCRLCLKKTKRGQTISLLHGEMLIDGRLSVDNILCDERCRKEYFHRDVYICKGAEEEEYQPRFTYHGFRYVFAQGMLDSQVTPDSLTLLEMHSDLRRAGHFACSDAALNTLQKNVCRSTLSNFYYFPTDCPHREKNGWTGDAALSVEQTLLNFHAENSLREWLFHIRGAQKEDGRLPGIVPTAGWGYEWGSGPAWDAALIYLPFYLYRYGAEREVLSENARAIAKYMSFLRGKRGTDGLLAFGLGDWCQPKRLSHLYETPLEVTDTLISINACTMAERIFSVLGQEKNRQAAAELARSLRLAYRRKYVTDGRLPAGATQTQIALSLAYGALEPEERPGAIAQLIGRIEQDGGCFATGVLGARELFRVLSENGYADLAYRLAMQDKFPSYYYHIKRGATTLFEDFHEFKEGTFVRRDGQKTNSLNHHFWGDISAWMYIYIAGIEINPDFTQQDKIVFRPHILQALSQAEGEYEHRRGKVRLFWRKEECGVRIEADIPPGTTADFVLPQGYRVAEDIHLRQGKNYIYLKSE